MTPGYRAFAPLALAVLGCALDVLPPSSVPANALDDPGRAPLLVQGAIADFECAFANYVVATAVLSDELRASSVSAPRGWDRRALQPLGLGTGACDAYTSFATAQFGYGIYTPLSTARFQADSNFLRIQAFPDAQVRGKDSLLATLAAYAGYSYTLFGEGFCWSAFDLSPQMAPTDVLARAEQRFTTALDFAQRVGDADILNMALVGRARVRLDLGKTAEAAADARLVAPQGYVKYASRAGGIGRTENIVYDHNYTLQHVTVDPRFRNLTVGAVSDPRVAVVNAGRVGSDGTTPLWYQTKYTSAASPIPIASWDEAQLIIAEAEGGQSAVTEINLLRSQVGLPLFSSPDSATIAQQVREERKRELFLEGHRLNDMLRFNLPFDIGPNYQKTARLPLPAIEIDNNPNIQNLDPNPAWGCLR